MTHAGPLTPIGKRSTVTPGLTGLWRAVVERLDPLAVSVPALAGQGSVIGKVEAVPGLTLAEGTRVWVACIEGDTRDLLIVETRGDEGADPAVTADTLVGATAVGKAVVKAVDAAAARTAISAPAAADLPTADTLTGATTVGKAVVKAVDAAAARTAISAVGKGDLFINVKDNGVKGDGATDDAPALRTLFSAAVAGTTFYFPTGSYVLATAASGVIASLTGLANITIKGAGQGTVLQFAGVTATDGVRIDGCRGFTMQDVAIQVVNTASRTVVTNGIQFTCPDGGGAHNGTFNNVLIGNPTKAYRPIWDASTVAGSAVITSASAAFTGTDVNAGIGIVQQLDVIVATVSSVNTRTTTISGAITASQTSITLASAIPSAPNNQFSIKIDSELLWVTAGFQTTTLTVARAYGLASGAAAIHADGATVTTYQATTDTAMATTSSNPLACQLQTAAAAIIRNGFAVGTDHVTAAMDIPQLKFIGCNAEYMTGTGWRLGPGLGGNILNMSHVSCAAGVTVVGVLMNGAVTNWQGPSVGSNGCDFKLAVAASQPVVISGCRSEESGMFWETSGAGTGGAINVTIRDCRAVNFHAPDGVPIRHITTAIPLTLDAVTLQRDIDGATVSIAANGPSGSNPLYYHARGVSSNAGNPSPHPAAATTIVRNIQSGARLSASAGLKSSHGSSLDQTLTLGSALIQTRKTQTLAANGAVTIDASAGDAVTTLNANATSSSITNPVADQILRITWVQDGTGGRTYAWPSNCKFAGGSAPSDTTLSTRTTVDFRYDLTSTNWYELNRTVAVG